MLSQLNNMLGSHNSLSFATPKKWWGKLFRFVGKCQSKDIKEQYELGVRYFDIRIKFDGDNAVSAHGPIVFNCDIYEQLVKLLTVCMYTTKEENPVYIRVILEYNKRQKNQDELDIMFKQVCQFLKNRFGYRFIFVGGRRKYDWEVIYDFGNEEPELEDKYSSTTNIFGKLTNTILDKIDDWWPWLYAVTHNAKSYKNHDKNKVLFIDFINIGHKYYKG